jgi:hypothetical protein
MTSLNIESQAAIAITVGIIAWVIGAAVWEWASVNWERWLGRAVVGAGVLQLAAFSHYASRQVERLNFLVDVKRQNANDTDERTTIRLRTKSGREFTSEHAADGRSRTGIGYTTTLLSAVGRDGSGGRCCGRGDQGVGGADAGVFGMLAEKRPGAVEMATPSPGRRVCECDGVESCDCIDCRCCGSFAAVSARAN